MSTILEQIVGQTRADLVKRRHEISLRDLESMPCYESPRRNFRQALGDSDLSVIAEIKKASPSKGVIRNDFDPLKLAESYRSEERRVGNKCRTRWATDDGNSRA